MAYTGDKNHLFESLSEKKITLYIKVIFFTYRIIVLGDLLPKNDAEKNLFQITDIF